MFQWVLSYNGGVKGLLKINWCVFITKANIFIIIIFLLLFILQETPPAQGSASSWSSFTNGINNNSTQALEDLLERQWEQGGAFLMEQAQHFDSMKFLNL